MVTTTDVMLMWCTAGDVRNEFAMSVVDCDRHSRLGQIGSIVAGPRIGENRNRMVDAFATTDFEWLWMVDADMVFAPDALERLLATKHHVVGGLCRTSEGKPTMWRFTDGLDTERVEAWDDGDIVEVDATGTGCLLIHRSVLSRMKAKYASLESGAENPYPWFIDGLCSRKGDPLGEDTAFCVRARGLGIPIFVHTGVKVGHVKTTILGEVG